MPLLTFECISSDRTEQRSLDAIELVLAGWTGRDANAVKHHIYELAALGVTPPSRTPIFYRTSVELVTQAGTLQVLGPNTSGEIEYVLLAFEDGLWFTVGSDHTDREAESTGVALSKQLAGKVIAQKAWRLGDYTAGQSKNWDALTIRSWATIDGQRTLYQDATLANILAPLTLVNAYTDNQNLKPGTIMMSGTPPAIGGIRPAQRFDMEIEDTNTGRQITHGYDIDVLPVVS